MTYKIIDDEYQIHRKPRYQTEHKATPITFVVSICCVYLLCLMLCVVPGFEVRVLFIVNVQRHTWIIDDEYQIHCKPRYQTQHKATQTTPITFDVVSICCVFLMCHLLRLFVGLHETLKMYTSNKTMEIWPWKYAY